MMISLIRSLLLVSAVITVTLNTTPPAFAKIEKNSKKSKKGPKKEKKASTEKEAKKDEDETNDGDTIIYPGATAIHLLAKQAILIDVRTGKVLLEKNADQQMTPSSMSKMMTSYLIEEKIMKGELSLDTEFPVSETAWRMGGSKMFVPLNGMVKVSDLLRGIIIQSGNDACIVAAEGIAGSEAAFAALMNEKGKAMGLKATQFMNASGWPQEGHFSTARDLALLGVHVIQDHPEFYSIYSEKEFTYGTDSKGHPIKQGNRNPLLYKGETSCDGIKTGHTDDGGYGVVASFLDSGQRYLMVINGLKTLNQRAIEARKILGWAKQNFVNKQVYKKGDVIEAAAPVWLGVKETIPLVLADDVNILTLRTDQAKPEIKLHYESPIPAPFKKGDTLGKVIMNMGSQSCEVMLIAGEDCEKIGFMARFWRSITYLLWGKA